MRYNRVCIDAFGYELAPHVVTSDELDERIAPVYKTLRIPPGQIENLSGIRERRFWDPGQTMADGATRAGRKALANANVHADQIGILIYGGVCRDNLEPATACAVADGLGLPPSAQIYDISNACLGAVNGMIQVANAIELGQIQAGMVVCCETARQIVDTMIDRLLRNPSMPLFKTTLATLTGGSGAAAVILTRDDLADHRRRVVGGAARNATEHHKLCRWGPDPENPAAAPLIMETHAIEVLENGVRLGAETWRHFLRETNWAGGVHKTICHQVGTSNRDAILKSINVSPENDFPTFPYLGNIGTVSLPITAAIAEQRGFLQPGDRVGLLGIGSGLNCVMLGVDW